MARRGGDLAHGAQQAVAAGDPAQPAQTLLHLGVEGGAGRGPAAGCALRRGKVESVCQAELQSFTRGQAQHGDRQFAGYFENWQEQH